MSKIKLAYSARKSAGDCAPAYGPPAAVASAIKNALRQAGGSLSQRDLSRRLQRYNVTELEPVIDALVEAGTLTTVLRPSLTGRGPRSRILTLTKLKLVEPASVAMQMRPPMTEPEKQPLPEVTARELLEVAGAVQKARIIIQERPHYTFPQALFEALWDDIREES